MATHSGPELLCLLLTEMGGLLPVISNNQWGSKAVVGLLKSPQIGLVRNEILGDWVERIAKVCCPLAMDIYGNKVIHSLIH